MARVFVQLNTFQDNCSGHMFKCHLIYINTVQLPAESMKTRGCKRRVTSTHTHTHTAVHLHSLWHCAVQPTIHLFSATAVKYTSKWSSADEQLSMHTHTQGDNIWHRKGFVKENWETERTEFEGFQPRDRKRNGRRVSVWICLNWGMN